MAAIASRAPLDTFYLVHVLPVDEDVPSFNAILPQDRSGMWLDCAAFGEQHVRENFRENTNDALPSGDYTSVDFKISGLGGAFCDAGPTLHITRQCDE